MINKLRKINIKNLLQKKKNKLVRNKIVKSKNKNKRQNNNLNKIKNVYYYQNLHHLKMKRKKKQAIVYLQLAKSIR